MGGKVSDVSYITVELTEGTSYRFFFVHVMPKPRTSGQLPWSYSMTLDSASIELASSTGTVTQYWTVYSIDNSTLSNGLNFIYIL